jgi:hypothetical protein
MRKLENLAWSDPTPRFYTGERVAPSDTMSLITRSGLRPWISCTRAPAIVFLIPAAIRTSASLMFPRAVSRDSFTG